MISPKPDAREAQLIPKSTTASTVDRAMMRKLAVEKTITLNTRILQGERAMHKQYSILHLLAAMKISNFAQNHANLNALPLANNHLSASSKGIFSAEDSPVWNEMHAIWCCDCDDE